MRLNGMNALSKSPPYAGIAQLVERSVANADTRVQIPLPAPMVPPPELVLAPVLHTGRCRFDSYRDYQSFFWDRLTGKAPDC